MNPKPYDFHSHSVFCDGKNTLEEMVLSAIEKGLSAIGFSGHSYTSFDTSYCLKDEVSYFSESRRLCEKYKGQIEILCGIERDFFADNRYPEADYVIGSVHYVKAGDRYIDVDLFDGQLEAVKKHFGGDYLSFAESYFETVSKLPSVHKTDIIGHFDLIKIFNADGSLFDENCPRYINAGIKALDELLKHDLLFEINTGAIFRGRRSDPYPSEVFLRYIAEHGGKITLSGDSHEVKALASNFESSVELAKKCGFKSIYKITTDGKKELEI